MWSAIITQSGSTMIGTRNPNALIDAATFSTRRRSSAGSFVRRDFDSPARNFHLRSRDPLIEKEKPSPLEKVSTKSHFDLAVTLKPAAPGEDPLAELGRPRFHTPYKTKRSPAERFCRRSSFDLAVTLDAAATGGTQTVTRLRRRTGQAARQTGASLMPSVRAPKTCVFGHCGVAGFRQAESDTYEPRECRVIGQAAVTPPDCNRMFVLLCSAGNVSSFFMGLRRSIQGVGGAIMLHFATPRSTHRTVPILNFTREAVNVRYAGRLSTVF